MCSGLQLYVRRGVHLHALVRSNQEETLRLVASAIKFRIGRNDHFHWPGYLFGLPCEDAVRQVEITGELHCVAESRFESCWTCARPTDLRWSDKDAIHIIVDNDREKILGGRRVLSSVKNACRARLKHALQRFETTAECCLPVGKSGGRRFSTETRFTACPSNSLRFDVEHRCGREIRVAQSDDAEVSASTVSDCRQSLFDKSHGLRATRTITTSTAPAARAGMESDATIRVLNTSRASPIIVRAGALFQGGWVCLSYAEQ